MKDEPILFVDDVPPDAPPELIHLMVDLLLLPPFEDVRPKYVSLPSEVVSQIGGNDDDEDDFGPAR